MENEPIDKNDDKNKKHKKPVLGRGLEALIPSFDSIMESSLENESGQLEYFLCEVQWIHSNRFQPRMQFSDTNLNELCDSIKVQGILQPLIVRKISANRYELIAGERRLRAAKMAGLSKVPVIIKDVTDTELLEMSIVENIQRQDLNPLEEADAYQLLISEFNLTQEQLSIRVGKSRSAITNSLRLRQLPEEIKNSLRSSLISMGHARALLGTENESQMLEVWRILIARGFSVRQTEELIKQFKTPKKEPEKLEATPEDVYVSSMTQSLSAQFNTRVRIHKKGDKGKIEIDFHTADEFERIVQMLKERQQPVAS
ncbi:MAG: ParB/RepB/Spo0J family partition protein [Desulfobacterales bacterium]|nr:ParB/RepB/Spo0J family partition protein [Desulfobacterales bacterium]